MKLILMLTILLLFGCQKTIADDPNSYSLVHKISEFYIKEPIKSEDAFDIIQSIDTLALGINYEIILENYYKNQDEEKHYLYERSILNIYLVEQLPIIYQKYNQYYHVATSTEINEYTEAVLKDNLCYNLVDDEMVHNVILLKKIFLIISN